MLIAARLVQVFLVVCLIMVAQIAANDVEHHHAASVFFSSLMLIVLLGLATLIAKSCNR